MHLSVNRRSRQRAHLTPNEVAELLMVNPVTVRQWAARGLLRSLTTPGGHRRFTLTDVEEFARARGATPISRACERPDRVLVVHAGTAGPAELIRLVHASHPQVLIDVAHDAFDAGRRLESFRPHAMVLDLEMPGMDGLDVCRRLRTRPSLNCLRILAVGGGMGNGIAARALDAGANAWIPGTFDASRVYAELRLGTATHAPAEPR